MRSKWWAVPALIIMLVLITAAFMIGAWRGFASDRAQVQMALTSLDTVFDSRAEMGNNLLLVARRHVGAEDPLVKAVQSDVAALSSGAPLMDKAAANERLTQDADNLLNRLESMDSVQADARDRGYVTGLLPRGLEQSAQWADAGKYKKAAIEFNERLNNQLRGRAAKFLGMREMELFALSGDGL